MTQSKKNPVRLYTLAVFITEGPVAPKFAKKNPVVARIIQIRGNQTLARLHKAIFKAFDRNEEHLYQFQIGGKGPDDPDADRYVLPMEMESLFGDDDPAGLVTKTTMDSINLQVNQAFGYWFDFGDDWWHQINVVAIEDARPTGKYPRVVKRTGESPPQYSDMEE